MDNTTSKQFVQEHADRILAWEVVHGVWCYNKHLRPCRMAERLGLTTREIQHDVASIKDKLASTTGVCYNNRIGK